MATKKLTTKTDGGKFGTTDIVKKRGAEIKRAAAANIRLKGPSVYQQVKGALPAVGKAVGTVAGAVTGGPAGAAKGYQAGGAAGEAVAGILPGEDTREARASALTEQAKKTDADLKGTTYTPPAETAKKEEKKDLSGIDTFMKMYEKTKKKKGSEVSTDISDVYSDLIE